MRHPNYRRVKRHRSYTIEEAASLLGVHRNTVREWIRRGLPTCDSRRPILVLGPDLILFLRARRTAHKTRLAPGEIYCVRCRRARKPAASMADFSLRTESVGDLIGICPDCESLMYRRVSLTKLGSVRGDLALSLPDGLEDITGTPSPSVNCDLP
jgi:hypothetical protein